MTKYLPTIVGSIIGVHAVIHLMGLYAYWPLGELTELPYKTTLLNGTWDVGALGMQLYSALWLLATLLLLIAAYGVANLTNWWQPMLLVAAAFSLAVTALDWSMAYAGTVVDVALLLFALLWLPLLRALPAS